jgi:hypothetical protein
VEAAAVCAARAGHHVRGDDEEHLCTPVVLQLLCEL